MKKEMEFAVKSEQLMKIRDRVIAVLESDPQYSELTTKIESELKEHGNEAKLRIAFVGQYNAGKSTMISVLTGDKSIKIDSNIATDCTSTYVWNDVLLIDTPGLYTHRKDHDHITEEAIKQADILVYCLTYSLFDNILLDNFKKLAYEKGYAPKMLLVVNKMYSEEGDYNVLVSNYRKSLQTQLGQNYSLDEFPICFIAAQFEKEKDSSIRSISHFEDLVSNLNAFIETNGISSKLSTPIHILVDNIEGKIIEENEEASKDLYALLSRVENKAKRAKSEATLSFNRSISDLRSFISERAHDCANMIGNAEQRDIEEALNKASSDIEIRCDEITRAIVENVNSQNEELYAEFEEIINSDAAKYYFALSEASTNTKTFFGKNNGTTLSKVDLANVKKLKGILESATPGIVKSASGVKAAGSGFISSTGASGSVAHTVILNVGKFFGVKFKPWAAVNAAKNVGNFAKILGPIAAAAGIIFEVLDAQKEKEMERQLKEARLSILDQFNSNSEDVCKQYKANFNESIAASFDSILQTIAETREDSIEKNKNLSKTANELKECVSELKKLL